jgi:AcrR family transcriptional regulator
MPAALPPVSSGRDHLTRPRVVSAALAIVDRDGIDSLTMRALGRELGVDPMAAYHWFPNKFAILQGVSEAILSEIVVTPEEPGAAGWQNMGAQMATEYRAALLRHPNALPVASTQPVMTPRGFELIEKVSAVLVAGGLTAGAALEVINTIAAFVIGMCVVQVGVSPGSEPVGEEAIMEIYSSIDPARFPNMVAAVGELTANPVDEDTQFATALEALLRGLDSSLRERGLIS